MTRIRRVGSISGELIKKSKESMLAAIQVFNSPSFTFKSESFIVLANIAWTYLLHAYYRSRDIEYRYYKLHGKIKRFDKTKHGAYKHWELERCLDDENCPLDKNISNNLKFLIGLRHEIEHQMTTRIDDFLSAKFQACCLNYNDCLKNILGENSGIEKYLSFSLQFSSINEEQKTLLEEHKYLPANIQAYINVFDTALTEDEYSSPKYAYRLFFIPKTANHRGQADKVIEFFKSDSPLAQGLNKEYTVIKETDKKKYLPKQVVEKVKKAGFGKFSIYRHTLLWKELDAKNVSYGYGNEVADDKWYWYEKWIEKVVEYCIGKGDYYK